VNSKYFLHLNISLSPIRFTGTSWLLRYSLNHISFPRRFT